MNDVISILLHCKSRHVVISHRVHTVILNRTLSYYYIGGFCLVVYHATKQLWHTELIKNGGGVDSYKHTYDPHGHWIEQNLTCGI